MDAEDEDWLRTVALERLRARGWRGTVGEYRRAARELGFDPLDHLDEAHATLGIATGTERTP